MNSEKLVPKLRFDGFDDEWVKTSLGDISSDEMYGMNSASTEYDGLNKYIRITDISETSNKFIPNPLTSPDGTLEEKYKLKTGDIVFARTGASTGKTYLYDENDGNLYFAGFLIKFHVDNAYHKFIFYNTLKEEYKNWVCVMSVRSGQPGINSNEYKKLPMYLPSFKEQEKISKFIESIDNKINLLEQKHHYYQDFKKYLMQQIFTQKSRFNNYNDNWNETKIKNIAEVVGGGTPKTDIDSYWNGDIKWYTPSEIGKTKYITDSERHITEDGLKNSSAKLLPKNTILLSSRATVGEVSITLTECSTNQGFQSLITKNNVDTEFIYYLISNIKNEFLRRSSGSTFLEISKNEIKKIRINIPSLNEQKEIGKVLSNTDEKIFYLEESINKTQEFKKGLLQQMFV